MKVYLFGSKDLFGVPDVIKEHIRQIIQQLNGDVEFIVADGNGIDAGYHAALSEVGARELTSIYTLGDVARSNKYDLKTHKLDLVYNPDIPELVIKDGEEIVGELFDVKSVDEAFMYPEFYEIRARYLAKICDFAICFTEPDNKAVQRELQKLALLNKYVYTYKVAV